MYRKSGLLTLIVFVLSFFFYPFVAAADIPDEAQNEWVKADNSFRAMGRVEENYDTVKKAMETLNDQWNSNQEKVARGANVTVSLTGGAIINAAVAVASGGSLAPAAFAAFLASKTAGKTAATSFSSQQYLDAMSLVSGALSTALTDVQTTYSTYSSRYSAYITEYAKHNLIRFGPNNTPTSVYTSVQLDSTVNTLGLDDGYYHASASSPSDYDHGISEKGTYKHWEEKPLGYGDIEWNTVALEAKYKCKGACKVKFESPYNAWSDHRVVCGIDRETFSSGSKSTFDDSIAPCGRAYYTCKRSTCPDARYHVDDDDDGEADDGDSDSANSKSGSLSGSSSASAGGSVTIGLSTTTAFSSVYWYVAGPGDSGLGSHVETDTGGSSSTTDSFTYTFPSDATSGDWTITAYIYNYSDSSTYETSYTVNVSGSRYTVSDDTPNCSDCTSHCSSPCSCSNSGTCNGSVYTPPSTPSTPPTPPPTPSTPTIVACGGAAWTDCAESVSSRTQHKVSSCSNCGKHYWTCMSGAVERHTEVLTCKRSGCGATLTRCQNGPNKCDGKYHWL